MKKPGVARPKVREPQRVQAAFRFEIQEDAIPPEHPARVLWTVLGGFDLSPFLADVQSAEHSAGRHELSPRMKLTLWLYGLSRGIGSARAIASQIETDLAFQWIVGDQRIGHHALSQFRAEHGEAIDALFSSVVSQLLHRGLIDLSVMGQDGTRVRAAASAPSFRTYGSLLECREQAALHLKATLAQAADPMLTEAQKARREAAARDFQHRVEGAIEACKAQREAHPEAVARGSTSDAEARVMKMSDGGFRPGLNVQYGVVGSKFGGPRTIVGVRVINVGSDLGSLVPMVEQVERRLGAVPEAVLADSNHAHHGEIAVLQARGIKAIVAVPKRRKGRAPGPHADKSASTEKWRAIMASEEGKELLRQRGALSELANAQQKEHQGMRQFLVRGIVKALNVALLGALSANLIQHAAKLIG